MKALQVHAFDAHIQMTNVDIPEPSRGQIRIKIAACGLNFADLLMQKGTYQDTPEPPFTLGMEVAGIVDAIGPDTDAPDVGSRVAVFGGQGGLAEFGCFDVDRMITLPDSMPFSDAAALQIAYGTSHVALDHRASLQAGETLLVLGAAGGVGLTAVELGKLMGMVDIGKDMAVRRSAIETAASYSSGEVAKLFLEDFGKVLSWKS